MAESSCNTLYKNQLAVYELIVIKALLFSSTANEKIMLKYIRFIVNLYVYSTT